TGWCCQQWWPDLGHWLNPSRLRAEGLWQPHLPARIVAGQLGGIQGRRLGEVLWLLVMWQQWRAAVLGETLPSWGLDHPFWLPRW
ncbi:hypothetical protein, partial [Haemophilus parainfluenzae]|uniref:hypothetical protein n=1 Tax=Haemophilus parainfluenzae TaxID=729 RepID=UPI001CEC8193